VTIKLPEEIKRAGGSLLRGLVAEATPGMAKGFLLEFLQKEGVDVKKVSGWVEDNVSLWGMFPEESQAALRRFAEQGVDISWLTFEWLIDSIKKDYSALASLFIGWPKAANYLKRQVEIMKREILK